MRPFLFILLSGLTMTACRNSGQNTASEPKTQAVPVSGLREIIVDADRQLGTEVDFSVLQWRAVRDTLLVIVRYSGGCEEHYFNAYFSGAWLKSLPPQTIVSLEHLNPKKDPCRSLVKDTLRFDMRPLRYESGNEVVVKLSGVPGKLARYRYGK